MSTELFCLSVCVSATGTGLQLSEIGRFVELQLTFFQQWRDGRLALNDTTCHADLAIPLLSSQITRIWRPEIKVHVPEWA